MPATLDRTVPLAATSYPDALPRAAMPPSWAAIPTTIGRSPPIVSYPDTTSRKPQTPSWSVGDVQPERNVALAAVVFPDTTSRLPTQEQQYAAALNALPRIPVTTWLPCYPDTTRRLNLPAFEQMAQVLGHPASAPICLHLSDAPLLTLTLGDMPFLVLAPSDTPLLRVRIVDAQLLTLTTADEPLLTAKLGEVDC